MLVDVPLSALRTECAPLRSAPGHFALLRSIYPMAVTAQRRLETTITRRFGSGRDPYAIPDLTEIQTKSYARFLQYDASQEKRKDDGLEAVLREIFPIESYDKKLQLDYLRYEL